MLKADEVTGIILCGGQSSRMGFNKALLQLDEQYVLLQTAKVVTEVLPEVVFVTDNQDKFRAIPAFNAYRFWEDDFHQMGPLGGLVTALKHVKTEYIFLIACDIPNVKKQAIQKLLKATSQQQVILYQQKKHLETLFGLYHRDCLPIFEKQLQSGERKIRTHFSQLNLKLITDTAIELQNINTPAELPGWRIKKMRWRDEQLQD